MKHMTLLGSVAAGLLAAAAATPAFAQATTYPEGTDCSAIQNSASKTECMNQMDESRQNPVSGNPEPGAGSQNVAPGGADDVNRGAAGGDASQPNGSGAGSTGNTYGGNSNNNSSNTSDTDSNTGGTTTP